MINTVRATVLSIANKNNFGYITPADFNLYAKQAQLDIFEDYFYQYNSQTVKQNARVSGSGYADILKGIEEVVDSFSSTRALLNSGLSNYQLPEDYYLMNKINYYPNLITSGASTIVATNRLIDQNANFINDGVQPGMLITNVVNPIDPTIPTTGASAFVVSVSSPSQLELSANIIDTNSQGYAIVNTSGITEVERVSQNKIFYLNSSHLTQPNATFPAYVLGGATTAVFGNTITVYPNTITTEGTVIGQYIRYPRDPNWTYFNIITGGEPSFDETAPDYQDFELPDSDQTNLVSKILQYAGMSIREIQLAQFGKSEENEADQQEG